LYRQSLVAGESLELTVFLLQLLDPLDLRDTQVGVYLLPAVEGLLGNAVFSQNFFVCGGFFRFPEDCYDLFFRKPFLCHLSSNLSV
jgi:hypothetical protein